MKTPWALACIALAALAIWAPTLAIAQPGDSFSYDVNWSAQFTQQFLAGGGYPRWLAGSFDGLGAPVFYFYPPMPFWSAAIIGGAGHGWLSPGDALKAAELFFLALSGFTMFAWLKLRAGDMAALLGALLFMIAPYHLDDHYVRGAFAEFAAIAFLPLIAFGLAKTGAGARLGPLWLALGWACEILCHLPMALLAGVLLIAPYGGFLLYQARGRRLGVALRMAMALAAGIGLASIYILPSSTLQDWISSEYWWSGKFEVWDRLFANPASWSKPLEPFLGFLSLAEAALAGWIGWRAFGAGERAQLIWAGATIVLFLIMAGLVPGFWSLPLMAKVQFPWRAMALQDFCFVTLIASVSKPVRTPLTYIVLGSLIAGNLFAVGRDVLAGPPAAVARAGYGVHSFPTDADAPEYLPKGMLRMTSDGPAPAIGFDQLGRLPLASDPSAAASADPVTGAVTLRLPAGQHGPITLRRFYFPSWSVACDGQPVAAAPGFAKLVTFTPPPGARACQARIAPTAGERLGGYLAIVSALVLAVYALWAGYPPRRRREARQTPLLDTPTADASHLAVAE
jgi:hypothetical protein